jgi:DNA-directed RNA polymerase sigma subunit (sigma70/sigma32)
MSLFNSEDLNEGEKEIFISVLVQYHGRFTCEQIGELAGISKQRIHIILQGALKKLEKRLQIKKSDLIEAMGTKNSSINLQRKISITGAE